MSNYIKGENFLGTPYDYYSDLNASQVAEEYDPTSTYAVGDYCIHDTVLYRCKTAISTAETWTSGHWEGASVGDDLSALGLSVVNGALRITYEEE